MNDQIPLREIVRGGGSYLRATCCGAPRQRRLKTVWAQIAPCFESFAMAATLIQESLFPVLRAKVFSRKPRVLLSWSVRTEIRAQRRLRERRLPARHFRSRLISWVLLSLFGSSINR